MLLLKLFQIIDSTFIGRSVNAKLDLVKKTNPRKFYVENIRAFFKIPRKMAVLLCEMAVRENYFVKGVEVHCPQCGKAVESYNSISDIPKTLSCDVCEYLEKEEFVFKPTQRDIFEFYTLKRLVNNGHQQATQ